MPEAIGPHGSNALTVPCILHFAAEQKDCNLFFSAFIAVFISGLKHQHSHIHLCAQIVCFCVYVCRITALRLF